MFVGSSGTNLSVETSDSRRHTVEMYASAVIAFTHLYTYDLHLWVGQVWFVCGWQVKLCDPLVTHGPYMSALEIRVGIIKRYRNWSIYFTLPLTSNLENLFRNSHSRDEYL